MQYGDLIYVHLYCFIKYLLFISQQVISVPVTVLRTTHITCWEQGKGQEWALEQGDRARIPVLLVTDCRM